MDKADIFKRISVKDLNEVDMDKCAGMLGTHFEQFEKFCNFLIASCKDSPSFESNIKNITCSVDGDDAYFETTLSNGETSRINFDNPEDIKVKEDMKVELKSVTLKELEEIQELRDQAILDSKKKKVKIKK